MKVSFLFFIGFLYASLVLAQKSGEINVDGKNFKYQIDASGDTIILADLGEMTVSSFQSFDNEDDYKKYRRYKRYAYQVYPYAAEAVRIFREVEKATEEMRKGKRHRLVKDLQKELSEKFEKPLKQLSKTQGLVLMKMIERELDVPMFSLIKDLRGGFVATYWSAFASFYGHHLREGYERGKDPILDVVLDDINLNYTGSKPSNKKQ
jgi:hypothetical protein